MIWEPACGDGAISKVLEKNGYSVRSTDLFYRNYGELESVDFLKTEDYPVFPFAFSIITNPPYNFAEAFIRRALDVAQSVQGQVAMLLRNEYDCAATRVDLFRHPYFTFKLVLTKRPHWIAGTTGSPRHNYAWYVWDTTIKSKYDEPTIGYDQ
jgi:hypothetical protein